MIALFRNQTYARLFAAQVVALLGTGLLTVALGLLAFDLAGANAGAVLGTALTIKMVAYVGVSPVAQALTGALPQKAVMIGADLVRAAVALALPFIDAIWQIYVLIFLLQAASATFTPAFQALIPQVLPDERDYTRALSLSRLAYDLESLVSPALAGLLLAVMTYHWLFLGTVAGFLGSALLVWAAALPPVQPARGRPFIDRLTRGTRLYLATPRLRGLLALIMAAASMVAFVLVNTVVIVRGAYGGSDAGVALALAAFGGGSMAAALALPPLLERLSDRPVMLTGAGVIVPLMLGLAAWMAVFGLPAWSVFLALWALSGAAYAAIMTPSGRLLRASVTPEDLPAIFAAQFALSHACWLVTYPLAGWVGALFGLPAALALLGALALAASLAALALWPADDGAPIARTHPDLPLDHPHLAEGPEHDHAIVTDDLHPVRPTRR